MLVRKNLQLLIFLEQLCYIFIVFLIFLCSFIVHQFVGVDPLQAGNAVQLIFVLALTIGWISSYMFRVANKDMTYAQQLKDYEKKVMEVVQFN